MIKRKQISDWGGWLFILLCLVLIMGHSNGMITLYALFCVFFMLKIHKIDNTSILLAVFSLSYMLFSYLNGAVKTLDGLLIYGLPWFFFYNYGKYVTERSNDERSLIDFLLIIAFLGGLMVYFTTIQRIIATGSMLYTSRKFYLFEEESRQISGNLICVNVYMGYVGLAAFFLLKKWKIERWLFLGLFVLSIIVAFNVISRFPIVAAILCFVAVVFIKYRGKPGALIGVLITIMGLGYILFSQSTDLGLVFDAYSARNEDLDNVLTFSNRSYRWTDAFEKMFQYPFGWYGKGKSYVFVHNMWLDIAKYSGIIPFILLVIVTIKSFITNYKILKIRESALAFIFFSLNLCFFLVAFVEPLYGGISVSLCCLVWGMQASYLNRIRNNSI